MRDYKKLLRHILILLALIMGFINQVKSQEENQEKINLSLGIGFPEAINVGVGYQFDPIVLACGFGSILGNSDRNAIAIFGEIRYHFAGYSQFSYRQPWFGSIGINYLRDETSFEIEKNWFLNMRIGREFNIDDRFGINFAIGAMYEFSKEEIRKQPRRGWAFDFDFLGPVFPSVGLSLFYKI